MASELKSTQAGSIAPDPDLVRLCEPFVFGKAPPPPWPCSRYLSDVPAGLLINWAGKALPAGALILDPFGASPASLVELARQGYAVVTCMLNPILRLTLEGSSRSSMKSEALSALDELACSLKENIRFDEYLQSLYQVVCEACGQQVHADEYIWDKGAQYPLQVIYDCPACHTHHEADCGPADWSILDRIRRSPLHRALAIDRITGSDTELKQDAINLVDTHSPRALHVLVSIFSRLDALNLNRHKRRLLTSLLVPVLDAANTLWPLEHTGFRPHLLSTPTMYREFNLWKKIQTEAETSPEVWGKVRLVHFPQWPEPGEICVFPGRVKDLLLSAPTAVFNGIATVIPRPNQAFWKLSAAWSAWFLEGDESRAFARMIVRDRYDWTWHAHALERVFSTLSESGKIAGRIQAVMSGVEPAFLSSVIPAAQSGGWNLSGFAYRHEDHLAELSWKPAESVGKPKSAVQADIEKGAAGYLQFKGEPADYLEMTIACLLHLSWNDLSLVEQDGISIQSQLKVGFSNPARFIHIGPGGQTLESGYWGLIRPAECGSTLTDRVEMETISLLNSTPGVTPRMVEEHCRLKIPASFIGLESYIHQLLASYAARQTTADQLWSLKEKEIAGSRMEVVERLTARVGELGRRLKFTVKGTDPIRWLDESGMTIFKFHIYYHTAFIGGLQHQPQTDGAAILVLPASRLDLLAYKQKELPAMDQLIAAGLRIVKFRLMSRLVENPNISRQNFDDLLKTDPVENNPDQLFLF